jgi:hypothetical protein
VRAVSVVKPTAGWRARIAAALQPPRFGAVDLGTPKNRRVLVLALVTAAGTWASAGFHYILGSYFSRPYPFNTFLFKPDDAFGDFAMNWRFARDLIAGTSRTVNYTPFSQSLMGLANAAPQWLGAACMIAALAIVLAYIVSRFFTDEMRANTPLTAIVTLVLVTMTYPVLFTVDRANEEAIVFILLFAFVYLYFVRPSRWAAFFLGAAIAYKIYPVVLVVLFVADRRWRDVALTFAAATGLLAVGTFVLGMLSGYGPAGVLSAWRETLFGGHVVYSGKLYASQHGHSIWGALVGVLNRLRHIGPGPNARIAYFAIAVLVFLLLAALIVRRVREPWQRLALLVIAMLVLPFESHDYTLIHLLLPLMLFVGSPRRRADMAYTLLFAALLVPLDYYVIIHDVSISTLLYPAALLAIAGLIVRDALRPPGDVAPGAATAEAAL